MVDPICTTHNFCRVSERWIQSYGRIYQRFPSVAPGYFFCGNGECGLHCKKRSAFVLSKKPFVLFLSVVRNISLCDLFTESGSEIHSQWSACAFVFYDSCRFVL